MDTPGGALVRSCVSALVATLSLASGGCGSTAIQPDSEVPSGATLTVLVNPGVLGIGETAQGMAYLHSLLTITVAGQNWQSSDPSIAPIRTDGFVTALAKGTTTISAQYQTLSATSKVRVLATEEVQLVYACGAGCGVKSDGSEVWSMSVGGVQTFVPRAIFDQTKISSTVYDVQPGNRSIWSSSNSSVVSVSASGQVTAIAKGVADVMATWDGATATVRVTVS